MTKTSKNTSGNLIIIVGLFLFLAAVSVAQAGGGQTLDIESYWHLVEDTRQQAVWAKTHPVHEIRPTFLHAAQLWENLVAVRMPDRTEIPLDTSAIVAELRADPPDPERVEMLLNALLEQRQEWPDGTFGYAEIRKLQDILARPEYQWNQEAPPSPLENWLAERLERFGNWLSSAIEGALGRTNLYIWQLILIGLGVLMLFFIFGYVGRAMRHALTTEAELTIHDHSEENLSAEAAISKAQGMSKEGNYRQAVRYLYLAALLQLEEHGLLRYDRSRTNREYLITLRNHLTTPVSDLSEIFAGVIDVFDRVWYGYQPLDQAGYEHYAAQVARLREWRPVQK